MGTFFELFLEATGKQRTVLKQNSSYNLIKCCDFSYKNVTHTRKKIYL